MDNLIQNPSWQPGPDGGPLYFSGVGPTYDSLVIGGYRTCTISIPAGSGLRGRDVYDNPICVHAHKAINWGFYMRTVEAQSIVLVADFYDRRGALIRSDRCEIAPQVGCEFHWHIRRFPIPQGAQNVHLSVEFCGTITACTYLAPIAYLD